MSENFTFEPRKFFEERTLTHFSNEVRVSTSLLVLFIVNGSATLQVYEHVYELNQYDIAIVGPEEIYTLTQYSRNLCILTYELYQNFLEQLCPEIKNMYIKKHVINAQTEQVLHTQFCTTISKMIYPSLKKEAHATLEINIAYASLLSLIVHHCAEDLEDTTNNETYVQQRIHKILEFINAHYYEKISLGTLADYLGIHPQYLSTFFKKYLHMNFVDYLNMVRCGKAFAMLSNPSLSITDVSLNCGFASYKTFVAVFKKIYDMTPSQYRKNLAADAFFNSEQMSGTNVYDYFTKFYHQNQEERAKSSVMDRHMNLYFDTVLLPEHLKENQRNQIFSVGRASALLRQDLRDQIMEAKKELKFNALRIRDIFSDDLYVYNEDEDKNPIYNWQLLSHIFDFLLSLGIHPYPVIGYMPKRMAAKKQYAGWYYQPNVSFPKSLKKWSRFVEAFAKHMIARYGVNEVRQWYFDFWTAPNLKVPNGYWQEDMESFLLFYRVTYISLKNADEQLRIGTPDSSLPSGANWYEYFFEYCRKYDISPDYVCVHLYNSDDSFDFGKSVFAASLINRELVLLKYEKDTILYNLKKMKTLLENQNMSHLPILISDWNNTYFSRDLTRDTCFNAAYVCYVTLQLMDYVKIASYRSLSDIHEDFYPSEQLFMGGPGIMDMNGLKKSVYYAFLLLDKLGDEVIEKGHTYIMTRSEKGYQVLLFNFVTYESLFNVNDTSVISYEQRYDAYSGADTLIVHLFIKLASGDYRLKKTEVNRDSGSVYDFWQRMGSPQTTDTQMLRYMNNKSMPAMAVSHVTVEDSLIFDIEIPPHGVTLLEFEQIF